MAAEWWTSQATGLKTEKPQTLRRPKLVSAGACPLGPHIAVTSGVNLCVSNLAILCSRCYGVWVVFLNDAIIFHRAKFGSHTHRTPLP